MDYSGFKANVNRIVRDESSWSVLKVSTTALTAITVSLVSSKLVGMVNSFLLVGIASVCTATISEVYRIVLSLSHLSATKLVSKSADKSNADENGEALDGGSAGEIESTGESDSDHSESQPERREQEENAGDKAIRIRPPWKANPVVKFAGIFLVFSLLTLGVSYMVAKSVVPEPKVVESYNVIEKKESLSETEKESIVDSAARVATERAQQANTMPEDNTDRIESLQAELEQKSTRIEQLEKQVEKINQLQNELSTTREELLDVSAQLKDLQNKVSAPSAPPSNRPHIDDVIP